MIPVVVFSVAHSQDIYSKMVSYTIILKSLENNRILPMVIAKPEADAIITEINGTKTKFPLTHDLFKVMLDLLNVKINKVIVTDLKEETYYGLISFTHKNKNYEIDSRPSDAIALALRFNAPIYISNEVMNIASYPIELTEMADGTEKAKSQLDIFKEKLKKAIKEELYEEAAKLRDEIEKLEKNNK